MLSAEGMTSELGREQFLQLLVTQLRHQNPLEPIDQEAFIGQLAQFSTLEGVERLNARFADLLALQQLTQGTNLLGQVVVYEQAETGTLAQGVVEGIVMADGELSLLIEDNQGLRTK